METDKDVRRDDEARMMEEFEKDTVIELEAAMSGEREHLPGMPKEYSGWDVYNNEAKKVDTELVNDWKESLNSLLLFASIFAAVLTGFIIESKRLLELDPSDAMLELMISFTNSMANGSFSHYSRPQFEPESSSITINCLFFASLSASLVAALASVVALQWVADYDAAITRGGSSPEDRAKRRQFRYAGVVRWKMSEIIATLPLLLYSSVILFFSGLTLWVRNIHPTVGSVVIGGMVLALLFYGGTTLLSVASVSAPFRTPLSRSIYSFIYLLLPIIDSLSCLLPISSIQMWIHRRYQRYTSVVKRDDDGVKRDWLGMDALVWLASHLSISQDSYDRLLLLVNELRKQDQAHFTSPGFQDAPWFSIFDLLARRSLNTSGPDEGISKGDEAISEEEMRIIAILAHCHRIPNIYKIIQPTRLVPYCLDRGKHEYWSQYCNTERTGWSPSTSVNSMFLLLRDVPLPSKDTAKQLESTIQLSRWRNSLRQVQIPITTSSPYTIQDTSSGFVTTAGQIVKRCIKNGERMTYRLVYALCWRLEYILLESIGQDMDTRSCFSRPLLYYKALQKDSKLRLLHGDLTLLLARNINSSSGAERVRRVKEVITMMWVLNGDRLSWETIQEKQGMESFFDANGPILLKWVDNMVFVPHIREILEHLALAQAEQPDIGSLWRDAAAQASMSIYGLSSTLKRFNSITLMDVTPEQHLALIDLACRDIERCPPGMVGDDISTEGRLLIQALTDPCLRFMTRFTMGAQVEFVKDATSSKESWTRIAKYLMDRYEGTDTPTILKLQASAWFLAPEDILCLKALREPQALAWLKHIFEYPVNCQQDGHEIGEGHLLIHILQHVRIYEFPVNIPALTEFPMKDEPLQSLLAIFILSDGYEELLRERMDTRGIDEQCTKQLLEMASMLTSSQYSIFSILLAAHALFKGNPEDLAGFSICVNKALDLRDDQRSTSLILPLVSHMHVYMAGLEEGSWHRQAIARREATKTIDRLHTQLARMLIAGGQN